MTMMMIMMMKMTLAKNPHTEGDEQVIAGHNVIFMISNSSVLVFDLKSF